MAVSLTIDGNERSDYLVRRRVVLRTNKNGISDSFSFQLKSGDPTAFTLPSGGDEVIFTVGGTTKFKGRVIRTSQEIESKEYRIVDVSCKDYSWDADGGELIAETYNDETAEDIIADVKGRCFYPGSYFYISILITALIGYTGDSPVCAFHNIRCSAGIVPSEEMLAHMFCVCQ